jgi:hypothetical protein
MKQLALIWLAILLRRGSGLQAIQLGHALLLVLQKHAWWRYLHL